MAIVNLNLEYWIGKNEILNSIVFMNKWLIQYYNKLNPLLIKYYQNFQRENRYYKPKNSYNIDLVVSDFTKRGQKSFVGHGKIFRRLEISGVAWVLSTRGSSKYCVPVLVAIRVLFELGYTQTRKTFNRFSSQWATQQKFFVDQ